MKPVIALTPLIDQKMDETAWMFDEYFEALKREGAAPVMLDTTTDPEIVRSYAERFDGFVFTGGQDVAPEVYGREVTSSTVHTCPKRDSFESLLLPEVLKLDKPVLGICRGHQFISCALGGDMIQDIPSQYDTKIDHNMPKPYDVVQHRVKHSGPIAELLGKDETGINSCHHQAVKTPGRGLEVMGVSENGLIEALWRPESRFLWTVQWHPEFSYRVNEESRMIFRRFVEECAK